MSLNNPSATAIATFENCTSNNSTLTANQAKILLTENAARTYAFVQNLSSAAVTLVLGSATNAAINKGILLLPYGSYEISSNNLYVGAVSAISTSNAELSIVECVN